MTIMMTVIIVRERERERKRGREREREREREKRASLRERWMRGSAIICVNLYAKLWFIRKGVRELFIQFICKD